jgi:hypothetical protein
MCTFFSSTNNFTHAQTLSRMNSLSGQMNIARVNIECFTGCKRIKQWHISFVLGYLRMVLWKISTAISIKHRILATFNIKKKSILTACMPLINYKKKSHRNTKIYLHKWPNNCSLKYLHIVIKWNNFQNINCENTYNFHLFSINTYKSN